MDVGNLHFEDTNAHQEKNTQVIELFLLKIRGPTFSKKRDLLFLPDCGPKYFVYVI